MDDITRAPGTRPELDYRLEQSPSRRRTSVRRTAEHSHANGPSGLRTFLVGALIIGATTCLVLGLTMPVIELTYFYVWSDTHSFISIVRALLAEQEIFLAGILVVFSMFFPAIKLVYLLVAYTTMATGGDARNRALNRMAWLGKWSMLDVLVLALVIFYVKSGALTEAAALPGVYFFAGAVLMTMIAYALVEHSPDAQYR